MTRSAHKEHLVRPRWVWGGTGLLVAGAIVIGIGVDLTSWPWSIGGLVVLALGTVTAGRGGILDDFHGRGSVRTEIRNVVEGNVRPGVTPGICHSTPRSRRRVRRLGEQRTALERSSTEAPRPSPVGPAAVTLLLTALFLLVAQWELYPPELPGQVNATRSMGCVVVLGVAGLRMLTAQPGHRLRLSSAAAGLVGLLLVLNGVMAPHDRLATAVFETVCGLLACAAAAVVVAHEPPKGS